MGGVSGSRVASRPSRRGRAAVRGHPATIPDAEPASEDVDQACRRLARSPVNESEVRWTRPTGYRVRLCRRPRSQNLRSERHRTGQAVALPELLRQARFAATTDRRSVHRRRDRRVASTSSRLHCSGSPHTTAGSSRAPRAPANPLGHLIQEPKAIRFTEPGSDISRQLGLPQLEHRSGKLSRTDLREGNGWKVNGTDLGA